MSRPATVDGNAFSQPTDTGIRWLDSHDPDSSRNLRGQTIIGKIVTDRKLQQERETCERQAAAAVRRQSAEKRKRDARSRKRKRDELRWVAPKTADVTGSSGRVNTSVAQRTRMGNEISDVGETSAATDRTSELQASVHVPVRGSIANALSSDTDRGPSSDASAPLARSTPRASMKVNGPQAGYGDSLTRGTQSLKNIKRGSALGTSPNPSVQQVGSSSSINWMVPSQPPNAPTSASPVADVRSMQSPGVSVDPQALPTIDRTNHGEVTFRRLPPLVMNKRTMELLRKADMLEAAKQYGQASATRSQQFPSVVTDLARLASSNEQRSAYLAQCASRLLAAMPGNHGRTLSPDALSVLFDDYLSGSHRFERFFAAIERLGLRVERRDFQTGLLIAVATGPFASNGFGATGVPDPRLTQEGASEAGSSVRPMETGDDESRVDQVSGFGEPTLERPTTTQSSLSTSSISKAAPADRVQDVSNEDDNQTAEATAVNQHFPSASLALDHDVADSRPQAHIAMGRVSDDAQSTRLARAKEAHELNNPSISVDTPGMTVSDSLEAKNMSRNLTAYIRQVKADAPGKFSAFRLLLSAFSRRKVSKEDTLAEAERLFADQPSLKEAFMQNLLPNLPVEPPKHAGYLSDNTEVDLPEARVPDGSKIAFAQPDLTSTDTQPDGGSKRATHALKSTDKECFLDVDGSLDMPNGVGEEAQSGVSPSFGGMDGASDEPDPIGNPHQSTTSSPNALPASKPPERGRLLASKSASGPRRLKPSIKGLPERPQERPRIEPRNAGHDTPAPLPDQEMTLESISDVVVRKKVIGLRGVLQDCSIGDAYHALAACQFNFKAAMDFVADVQRTKPDLPSGAQSTTNNGSISANVPHANPVTRTLALAHVNDQATIPEAGPIEGLDRARHEVPRVIDARDDPVIPIHGNLDASQSFPTIRNSSSESDTSDEVLTVVERKKRARQSRQASPLSRRSTSRPALYHHLDNMQRDGSLQLRQARRATRSRERSADSSNAVGKSSARSRFTTAVEAKSIRTRIEEAQKMLRTHVDGYNKHHESVVKSRLAIMRKRGEKCQPPSVVSETTIQQSPFANLKSLSALQKSGRMQVTNVKMNSNGTIKTRYRHVPVITYKSEEPELPRYEYAQRASTSELSRNLRVLPAQPEFIAKVDDQEEEVGKVDQNLKEAYPDGLYQGFGREEYINRLQQSRQFYSTIEAFLSEMHCTTDDVVRIFIGTTEEDDPGLPKAKKIRSDAETEIDQGSRPIKDYETLARSLGVSAQDDRVAALIACTAFKNEMGFSMWQIAEQRAMQLLHARGARPAVVCQICFSYNCQRHGQYIEPPDIADKASSDEETSEDEDFYVNIKRDVTSTKLIDDTPAAAPTIEANPRSGRQSKTPFSSPAPTASPKGRFTTASGQSRVCSKTCALDRKASAAPFIDIGQITRWFSNEAQAQARQLLPALRGNPEAPCLLAAILQKPCTQTHGLLLQLQNENIDAPKRANTASGQPFKRGASSWTGIDSKGKPASITDQPSLRDPFYPCDHDGDCATAECSCFEAKVHCEKMCGCAKSCGRRFPGCKCARSGKACSPHTKCDCYLFARECDPDLCHDCGAVHVLDPERRCEEDVMHGRCRNVGIQYGQQRRLIQGRSQVHGYGLFVGEPIAKGDFLGEYKGEILAIPEWERRGMLYEWSGNQYSFNLNAEQEVDSAHSANKLRYINNSTHPRTINCAPAVKLCNTVSRIGLFATRDLEPGEELFFNYGYNPEHSKHFVEKEVTQTGELVSVKTAVSKAKKASGAKGKTKGLMRPKRGLSDVFDQSSAATSSIGAEDGDEEEVDEEDDDGDEEEQERLARIIAQQDKSDDEDYRDTRRSASPRRKGRRRGPGNTEEGTEIGVGSRTSTPRRAGNTPGIGQVRVVGQIRERSISARDDTPDTPSRGKRKRMIQA